MARTATQSTLTPGLFSTGNYIREEDVQEVAEALNYTHQNIRRMHLFVRSGNDGWGASGNEVATHGAELPTTSGAETRYRFQIWVDPDADSIEVGARMTLPASNEATVTITLGSGSQVLTFTATGEQTGSILTSASGTGLLTCTVATNHTVGSSTGCILEYWFAREEQPTIPAPPDE